MKPIRTWVLIADAAHARVLLNEGPGRGLRQLNSADIGMPHAEEVATDLERPGRVHESWGTTRHAIEASTSPMQKTKTAFARQIASNLEVNSGNFDRLIMIAAPGTLGTLRREISASVAAKLLSSIPKDLTGTPNDQIADFLSDTIAV